LAFAKNVVQKRRTIQNVVNVVTTKRTVEQEYEMAGVVEWAAPEVEPGGPGTHDRRDHAAIAKSLRENPGQWAVVRAESTKVWAKAAAGALASNIRGGRNGNYLPAGSFEAVAEEKDGMMRVYARYLGSERDGDASES
jgi:hypothetical protein